MRFYYSVDEKGWCWHGPFVCWCWYVILHLDESFRVKFIEFWMSEWFFVECFEARFWLFDGLCLIWLIRCKIKLKNWHNLKIWSHVALNLFCSMLATSFYPTVKKLIKCSKQLQVIAKILFQVEKFWIFLLWSM